MRKKGGRGRGRKGGVGVLLWFVIITKKIKKNNRSSPYGLSIEKACGVWLHPLNKPYVIGTGLGIGIWFELG